MKMIKVSKRPAAWKGIRDKIDKPIRKIETKPKKITKETIETIEERQQKFNKRKMDLYLYCKKTYDAPSSREFLAQEMKQEYQQFSIEYYIKVFELFTVLIDNKKIRIIHVEMFKDVNNIFIQMQSDHSNELIQNVAERLKKYIENREVRTKRMNALLKKCEDYLFLSSSEYEKE